MRLAEIAKVNNKPKSGQFPKTTKIPTVDELAGIKKTERIKSVEELAGLKGKKG